MRDGCAAWSRTCGEPLHGTASRARRWVLFEHPGAWGSDVLRDGTLPSTLAAHLDELSRTLPARVLLVRRPGRRRERSPRRTLLVGVSGPQEGWVEELRLDAPADLLDVDLEALGRHRSVGGTAVERPTYLVCTNGRHDPCCAEYGRPVVDALAPVLDERVWECSHVGGDRFAANLVCLPEGIFYGRLDPDTALAAVAAHEAGEVALSHWRGRSDVPFLVQAAEAYVRRELQLSGVADLVPDGAQQHDDGRVTVRFRGRDGQRLAAAVRRTTDATARSLTCAGSPQAAVLHELVEVVELTSGE